MPFRERLWMYAVVTCVTLLIWWWAAAETRTSDRTSFRVQYTAAAGADQVVRPREATVDVMMEGSNLALNQARQLAAGRPLALTVGNELPSQPGTHNVDLVEALDRHEPLTDTGIRVLTVEPATVSIEIDHLVSVTARIEPVLSGLETEGKLEVVPPQAVVRMPERLRDRLGEDPVLEGHLLQTRLDRLEPGVQHSLDATLRLPGALAAGEPVTIEPSMATVRFTLRSRIKETTLPTVKVQIAGPPKDHDEFVVEIENHTLADVTIKADGDLVRQIERGDAVVVALVHLSYKEKEQGIESKPVTCFMALPSGTGSPVDARIVAAEVAGSPEPPVIRFRIDERATP